MGKAEFEEKEYEGPLYNQLTGNRNIWSPGQVFEQHIGIDYAMLLEEEWIFNLHRFRRVLPGAALSRYRWPRRWFLRRTTNRLPTFRLNLFIQAKRSEWNRGARKLLRENGIQGPHWHFKIDEDQQVALETVWNKLRNRALVDYAAPAFHTHQDLYRHTRGGTIAENSTFPSVQVLKDHQAWYYQHPGASGVANTEPEKIEELQLNDRIADLIGSELNAENQAWSDNLKGLSADIVASLSAENLKETSRRATFFEAVNEIESVKGDFDYFDAWKAFYKINAFCETFLVDWYVLQDK